MLISVYSVLFYLLAAVILMATALAVICRNLVHTVVYLILSFLGTAMLYYLLGAPMLAVLEVIIYAGAIMVLFLFVIMLMQDDKPEGVPLMLNQVFFLTVVGGTAFSIVMFLLYINPGRVFPLLPAMVSPRDFGAYVFTRYWLAVEVVSFLLFVALVGAYYLSRGKSRPAASSGEK